MNFDSIEEIDNFVKNNKMQIIYSLIKNKKILVNDLFFNYLLNYKTNFLEKIADCLDENQKAKSIMNYWQFIKKCENPSKDLIDFCFVSYMNNQHESSEKILAGVDYKLFTDKQLKTIISKDPMSIKYIDNPSLELASEAVRIYPKVIKVLINKEDELIELALKYSNGTIINEIIRDSNISGDKKQYWLEYVSDQYTESLVEILPHCPSSLQQSHLIKKMEDYLVRNENIFDCYRKYTQLTNWDLENQKLLYAFLKKNEDSKILVNGLYGSDLIKNLNNSKIDIDPNLLYYIYSKIQKFVGLVSEIQKNRNWNKFSKEILKTINNE